MDSKIVNRLLKLKYEHRVGRFKSHNEVHHAEEIYFWYCENPWFTKVLNI